MMKKNCVFLCVMTLMHFSAAFAATQFQGADMFVTGEAPVLDDWSPGAGDPQLLDDGNAPDLVADDGIYMVDVTLTTGTGNMPHWKAASSGFAVEVPGSNQNSRMKAVQGETVTFVMDTRETSDDFLPAVGGSSGNLGFVYTIPSPLEGVTTVTLVGSFQTEVGNPGDWDVASTITQMHDDGLNGDTTAADGIYTLQLTGMLAGNYEGLIAFDKQWGDPDNGLAPPIRSNGLDNGNNIGFNVFALTDTLTFEANLNTLRYRITNDNPTLGSGPPFYALSDAWSKTLDDTTIMYDDGTHGDVTASDGIYARQFGVAAVSSEHSVQVGQMVGNYYPNSGGYPFVTTTANQQVLVQFDTNEYSDGYEPSARIVWTDPDSRRTVTYVQAIGDFMVDFGGTGNWNNSAVAFQLKDAGADGDVTAGDAIFALTFPNPALSGKQLKAIGSQGSWDYQFGGIGEGATFRGDNRSIVVDFPSNATVQADAVMGRVGVSTSVPTRPATIDAYPERVNEAMMWALFE